jgi:hypothetical protein
VALVGSMAATITGLGAANRALDVQDASSWLWSSRKGEISRVNALNGKVDTRHKIVDSQGHTVQVTQTDRYLILRDLDTGKVSALDLATLQVSGNLPTTPGDDISIALHGDSAFVVDSVQGTVAQVDPMTLKTVGTVLTFPPGISRGSFDNDGVLWLAVPTEGTVVAIKPGGKGAGPRVERVVPITKPNHELVVAVLDRGVAVLDQTSGALVTLRGESPTTAEVPSKAPGILPARTSGQSVPVTVVNDPEGRHDRHVFALGGQRVTFRVPGTGEKLSAAVGYGNRFYVFDEGARTVYVFDDKGREVHKIDVTQAAGPVELEVREGHLFINGPNSNAAWVVDPRNKVTLVNKYADNIFGGDKAKVPPAPQTKKNKPKLGPPSAPRSVSATAGNTTARVSWRAASPNGAPISRYVVEGAGRAVTVGANQRTIEFTKLDNGTEYTFRVHAVNAKGAGPKRASNPVVPTAAVPDPPASVTAVPNPDGTVKVSWPAADGQGQRIVAYDVTAIGNGRQAIVGKSTTTSITLRAGALESEALVYGKAYSFTVAAIGDRGAASKVSPQSKSVVPFNKPDAPEGVEATTVRDQKGAIRVAWQKAEEHGAPITHFVVEAGTQKREIKGDDEVTIGGFGNGANVKVAVYAVNKAGPGKRTTVTAKTVAPPAVTITGVTGNTNSLTVRLNVEDGGGAASCTVNVTGATRGGKGGSDSCTSQTIGNLYAGQSFNVSVSVSNAAGAGSGDTGNGKTDTHGGIVNCKNPPGDTYCNGIPPRKPGVGVYKQPYQEVRYEAYNVRNVRLGAVCRQKGEHVMSKQYNNNKQSDWWVRLPDNNYIPYTWLNLDGGDDIDSLAVC